MSVIVRNGYVVPSVDVINRFLWVPNFPLSTVRVNDHSQANEPLQGSTWWNLLLVLQTLTK